MKKILPFLFFFTISSFATAQLKLVNSPLGTITIPLHPQRILVLDRTSLEATLALGFEPIAAATDDYDPTTLVPAYLTSSLPASIHLENVGRSSEPNLEKIALLKPDLILLSASYRNRSSVYPSLAKLAPTLMSPGEIGGSDWRGELTFYAKALGREERLSAIFKEYDKKVAALKQRLQGKSLVVTVVRFMPALTQQLKPKTFIGSILREVGLKMNSPSGGTYPHFSPLGFENIPTLESDWLFYTYHREPMGKGKISLTEKPDFFNHPLWTNLKVVKNGRALLVPDNYWVMGKGIKAASLVLDDLNALIP